MNFKGEEIDLVLRALKEEGKIIYAEQLQEKYLPEWQVLKVESIFKYLHDNYSHRFEWTDYNTSMNMGYGLEYSSKWDIDLEKGGFDKYWEDRDKAESKISNILRQVGVGSDVIKNVLSTITFFQ